MKWSAGGRRGTLFVQPASPNRKEHLGQAGDRIQRPSKTIARNEMERGCTEKNLLRPTRLTEPQGTLKK